jgi:hypothetical protein
MPHKRTDISHDDTALLVLSGCQYKALQYLLNRADARGICYPSAERIASAIGFSVRNVWRALEVLNDADVMRYVRRDEWDNVTKRKLPNAYQINPDYISLAVDFVAEARLLWETLIDKCGNRSSGLWCHINQQPTPVDQSQDPTPVIQFPVSNTNNQRSPKTAARSHDASGDYTNPGEGNEKSQNGNGNDDTETNTQRSARRSKSSVPPAGRSQYANPEPIATNLPEKHHELLALEIRQLGISMPLARGFVATYGADRSKTALAAVRDMGRNAKNPPGLFRSIIQNSLADDFAHTSQAIFNLRRQ